MQETVRMALKAEILKKVIVDLAEVRTPASNYEVLDLHCNYSQNLCLSSLGGHFQQVYYVVAAIHDVYGDNLQNFFARKAKNPNDAQAKKALTPRELMIE